MEPLVVFCEFANFSTASCRAKELAEKYEVQTGIIRSPKGWSILVNRSIRDDELIRDIYESQCSHDDINDSDYSHLFECDSEQGEVMEELEENRDNWSKSEQDGWFYPD